MAPLVSHLKELGLVEAEAIGQVECFERAVQFTRAEGIIPAPEPSHAIAAAVREALKCKETGTPKVILTALCGHGHFDMGAYRDFLDGKLVDYDYPEEKVRAAMEKIPVLT
jgi:tryptophan synthase beta chain